MNTPAHILIGAAAFGRKSGRLLAAALGSMAPDLSLYLMAGVSLGVLGISPDVVFGRLYYSDAWQTVFAIDNSALLWGALLLAALWRGWGRVAAFAAAGLLHLALDFPLHAGDGRAHFWPFSDWVFHSPVSYWDSAHHAIWVAPVAVTLSAVSFGLLWPRLGWWGRAVFGALALAELWVLRQWLLFF